MKSIPLEILKEEIPHGYYCYTSIGYKDGVIKIKKCPYWEKHKEYGEQNDGYCSYLEIGDWMEVEENKWVGEQGDVAYLGLLWDQVKLCQINNERQ